MRSKNEPRPVGFFPKDVSLADAFECLFENAPDAIYVLDTHGRFAAVNRKAEELTGFKRENHLGKSFRKIVPTKSLPKATRGSLSVIRGKSTRLELELKTAANKTVLLEVTSTLIISNGKIVGTLGIVRDITERKKVEEVLESESYLDTIENSIFSGVIVIDGETHEIAYANPKALETIGASKERVIGKVCHSFVCPAEEGRCPISDLGQTVDKSEKVLLKADGKKVPILKTVTTIMWKNHKYMIESFIDITERKRVEEALQRSEEQARCLLEFQNKVIDSAVVWIHLLDAEGNVTLWNRAAELISGYSREEVVGHKKIWEWQYPDSEYRAECFRKAKEIIEKGARLENDETIIRCKDGALKTISWHSNNIVDEKGAPIGSISVGIDVTGQKRMAQELAYERDLLQTLMDNIPDTIYFKDTASRFTRINRAQARALGVKDSADAMGKTDFDFFTDEHPRNAYADEQKIVETGWPLISKVERIATPDGRFWWVSATKVPIKDKEGQIIGTVGISRDITEQKKMEEELRHYSEHLEELVEERTKELKEAQNRILKSERLAAIGELAGMVGHDLRNPLTGIAGAAYYLKTKCGQKTDSKAKDMLEIIEKDIGYANKIINDLLEYSREIKLDLTESNPKAITGEALSLVEIPENVQIMDLTEKEPMIKVDVDKLKRAFVNIIKNAVDAMPQGGKLTIESKKSVDNWEIAFSDTGIGMTKCMLEKIWSPLFTTKAKGMGFGLSICKRMVEAHGGKISVESAIAKGTALKIAIPINPPEREEKLWVNIPESLSTTMKT